MPSCIDPVAWSHSATTRISPGTSIAFSRSALDCYGSQGLPNRGPQPTGKPFCSRSLVLAVAISSLLLPSHLGPGTLKKKQPEVRHPLYRCAQTRSHFPGPSGQVLLQSLNQVPQKFSDPTASARLGENTSKVVVETNTAVVMRSDFTINAMVTSPSIKVTKARGRRELSTFSRGDNSYDVRLSLWDNLAQPRTVHSTFGQTSVWTSRNGASLRHARSDHRIASPLNMSVAPPSNSDQQSWMTVEQRRLKGRAPSE